MAKIDINNLKPGMKFTEAVYITPSNMLVGPDTPINEKDLDRLKRWGIDEVESAGQLIENEVEEIKENNDAKPAEIDYSFEEEGENDFKRDLIEEYKNLHKVKNEFKDHYYESIKELTSIVHDVKNDKHHSNMKIFNIATDLISQVVKNHHIFIYLATKISDEENYLPHHLLNTTIFSIMIGQLIKLNSKHLINLAASSLVFDIGMTKIPDAILKKNEKLAEKELELIKLHTVYGYKTLIKDETFPTEVAAVALQHHEQFDGKGYPRKLKAEQIDLFSRIISIADTYEAMTKKRSYREEFLSYEAMKNVLGQGQNKFDPKLIKIFLSNMSIYPVASLVKLNTNAIGMVIGAHKDKPLRPAIKIIIDEFGDKIYEKKEIILDLTKEEDLFIKSAVDEQELKINVFDLI